MNSLKMSLALLLLTVSAYGQSIKLPLVGSSGSPSTVITEIVTNNRNTIVSFKHICPQKGNWVLLNKSMYLQDAQGEERYSYVRSEGIPLRPEKFVATEDHQEVHFKVYFEKLKPGTKKINIIERALSLNQLSSNINFFNFFDVSLTTSQPKLKEGTYVSKSTSIIVTPSPPAFAGNQMPDIGPMVGKMYTSMLTAQLEMYSAPTVIDQLAKIMKNYYDALTKAGFSSDAALKIITSKQLISVNEGLK